ncbi:Cyclic nucleotide-binding protein [Pseudocohnilembus persalinus]|uniref:Cyclic nucleotide-binding protein n=1 Tax=Pseudocohnilembus persalinus TaxID=266149 RepID=A0A0V0R3A8_PSEPJ|nr:Cyclic nucleotide-binding protein [Pseudocohnilembus persalinus]|eukprot:KRX08941.1 Cyclic nucleotide-binding protein [Pseudocohnilembus persalinus]
MFGEMALINNLPRGATIVTSKDTQFAVLSAPDYRKILKTYYDNKITDKMLFFKQHLLNELPVEQIKKVAYQSIQKNNKMKLFKGQEVFKQGDKSVSVFLIKKGQIERLAPFLAQNQLLKQRLEKQAYYKEKQMHEQIEKFKRTRFSDNLRVLEDIEFQKMKNKLPFEVNFPKKFKKPEIQGTKKKQLGDKEKLNLEEKKSYQLKQEQGKKQYM